MKRIPFSGLSATLGLIVTLLLAGCSGVLSREDLESSLSASLPDYEAMVRTAQELRQELGVGVVIGGESIELRTEKFETLSHEKLSRVPRSLADRVASLGEAMNELSVEALFTGDDGETVWFQHWSMGAPGDAGGLVFSSRLGTAALEEQRPGAVRVSAVDDVENWFHWEDL